MADRLVTQVEEVRELIKRRREDVFDGEDEDTWNTYYDHVYDNLVNICAANAALKDSLRAQVAALQRKQQPRSSSPFRRGFPKCKETRDIIEDGGRIVLASRKTPLDDLKNRLGSVEVIDVSPRGHYWALHPAAPIGDIPVPNSDKLFASSVLGLYRGLRKFENMGISVETLRNENMKILRNPNKATGPIVGYQNGIGSGVELLTELEARFQLFIEPYRKMLDRPKQKEIVDELRSKLKKDPTLSLVFVDTSTPNGDWRDVEQEISHCALLRDLMNNKWPSWDDVEEEDGEEEGEEEEEEEEDSE